MEKFTLAAEVRDLSESPASLRAAGYIPAELYGHGVQNVHLKVLRSEFEKLFRKSGESSIIEVQVKGDGTHNVLIKDVSRHFVRHDILHVDFHAVSMTEKLQTEVVLEFIGESEAVKALGGTLVKVLDAVEVEALPTDLPHNLEVDIAKLKTFDDTITVKDIAVPKGVAILTEMEEVVAKVQPPRDVEAELAEPIVEDVESVGAVEKKKDEGEEAAEGAAPAEEGK